ncbi:uncharacterized protein BT62DRAFT_326884 [Guyanagaster necrorhizus]|uniref:Uncharacterized protein n=1 Tax=Guyanagaster necrorhizus TaxID=856835 RepID=A0A9P8APU8_9AGAR|nr:uncharacterized protein BT62DRAFT_326884 [Guyanagaster necrorhizus MCA 3950]KAG7443345.1 hypothetical protein BT62DRAFT_326884 [Guyanagaster necrorhizus MCA 3950]
MMTCLMKEGPNVFSLQTCFCQCVVPIHALRWPFKLLASIIIGSSGAHKLQCW